MSPSDIKAEILRLTREYSRLTHTANRPGNDPQRHEAEQSNESRVAGCEGSPATRHPSPATPTRSVPYAGRVFTEDEVEAAVSATLDFWLTLGSEGEAFEKELAGFLGVKHSLLVNSGSSANLIALTCLTTHKLPDHKRIRPGDEVITCAAGFPTTVAPIIQNGCIPVFIDNDPTTGNARVDQLEAAYSPGKTKAVMMAHTLGKPSAERYDWLGKGIYFWEHGPQRAAEWAQERANLGRIESPAVLGAIIQLGNCFDLLDTRYTDILTEAWPKFEKAWSSAGKPLPLNKSRDPRDLDKTLRFRDCSLLNWTLDQMKSGGMEEFDSVRGLFQEGETAFPDSEIRTRSHIQIAIRNPECIVGYFLPA